MVYGDAEFTVNISLSEAISTVGIVAWSIDKSPIDSASIEFGPDTNYRWTAPVDLSEPEFRTLLLGMKPTSQYHLRVVAKGDGITYVSDDYTIDTGELPTGLPDKTLTTEAPESLEDGFMVTCTYQGQWAFILDEDGDYVWWYSPGNSDYVRARLTFDGKHMVIANGNVPGPNGGTMYKVTMDGLNEESFNVPQRHHDAEVLPDGSIVYMEYETTGTGTCDRIVKVSPSGDTTPLFMVRDHFSNRASNGEWCHSNAINYLPDEDAFTLSILNMNTIIKFTAAGEMLWVLGGQDSDFPNVSWNAQHQHHLLGDTILLFNNRGGNKVFGGGGASRAIEYSLDESNMQASLIWEYSSGSLNSMAMGDAKRLPNGNSLVTFSASGVIHEVSPEGDTLRAIEWGMGGAVGYVEWRRSLYGPPEAYL